MKLGFVTCADMPEVTADDRLAADECRRRGAEVAATPWDDPGVPWDDFDTVVIRSAWTYHKQPQDFHGWLDRLEASGVRILNPPRLVRWNATKEYLFDLEGAGVPIPPSTVLRGGKREAVEEALEETIAAVGSTDVVAKPLVGASAYGVERVRLDDDGAAERVAALLKRSGGGGGAEPGILIQRFEPGVSRGEWSVIHLGGRYSHGVLKVPARGDFRVQEELGGRVEVDTPPDAVLALAEHALEIAGGTPLYSRVDVVEGAEAAFLMELELIEPHLHFHADPEAPARFAETLVGGR